MFGKKIGSKLTRFGRKVGADIVRFGKKVGKRGGGLDHALKYTNMVGRFIDSTGAPLLLPLPLQLGYRAARLGTEGGQAAIHKKSWTPGLTGALLGLGASGVKGAIGLSQDPLVEARARAIPLSVWQSIPNVDVERVPSGLEKHVPVSEEAIRIAEAVPFY